MTPSSSSPYGISPLGLFGCLLSVTITFTSYGSVNRGRWLLLILTGFCLASRANNYEFPSSDRRKEGMALLFCTLHLMLWDSFLIYFTLLLPRTDMTISLMICNYHYNADYSSRAATTFFNCYLIPTFRSLLLENSFNPRSTAALLM